MTSKNYILVMVLPILLFGCDRKAVKTSIPASSAEKGLAVTGSPAQEILSSGTSKTISSKEGTGIRWAIVIGINEYDDPAIVDLTYAARDAETISEILKSGGEFDTIYTFVSGNAPDRQPSKNNLIRSLNYVMENAEAEDTVLIYYSGHGFAVGGQNYMCVQDSILEDVQTTGINIDDFITTMKKSQARVNLAFIDACREEVTGNTKSIGLKAFSEADYRDAEGVAILFATRFGDFSYEDPELGMGVFSYYIKEGLLGRGDENGDNYVSYKELSSYVVKNVNDWSRSRMKNQKPFISGEWSGDVLLTTVGARLSADELSALSPVEVLERYLNIWKWEDRLPYILDPDKHYSAMKKYYRDQEFKGGAEWNDFRIISPEEFGGPKVTQSGVSVLLVAGKNERTLKTDNVPIFYVFKKTPKGWKIDWANRGSPDSPTRPDILKLEKPDTIENAMTVYGFISLDDLYLGQFRGKENEFYCFDIEITHNDTTEGIWGYAPKNSRQGKNLVKMISDSSWDVIPVTLKVAYVTRGEGVNKIDYDQIDIVSLEHPFFY